MVKKRGYLHLHDNPSYREMDELYKSFIQGSSSFAHLHFTESVYVDALSVNKVKHQHFTLILIKPKQVDA